MAIDYDQAIAAVEVFALEEVRNAPSLGSSEGEFLFKRLMLDAVTLIVEEHLADGVRLGGRHVDGDDDEDGDGPRLHVWLEKRGVTYRLVILRFDRVTRTPPVVTDTMAIVHGERALIGRFVVYGEAHRGRLTIEHIPGDRLSDDHPLPKRPRRPVLIAKPVVHRLGGGVDELRHGFLAALGAVLRWLRRSVGTLQASLLRAAVLSRGSLMRLQPGWYSMGAASLMRAVRLQLDARKRGRHGTTCQSEDHVILRAVPLAQVPLRVAPGRSGHVPELTGLHLGRLHGVVEAHRKHAPQVPPPAANAVVEMAAARAAHAEICRPADTVHGEARPRPTAQAGDRADR